MESPGVSGQLDTVYDGARESQSGNPMGQIQFAWFFVSFSLKQLNLNCTGCGLPCSVCSVLPIPCSL